MMRVIVGVVLGLGLIVAAGAMAGAVADPPPQKLTPEERKKLQVEWKDQTEAGINQSQTGKPVEAEKSFLKALDIARRLYPKAEYPAGHRGLANSLFNLANLLEGLNRYEDAEPLLREAVEINKRWFTGDHENTATFLDHLGHALQHQGKDAEAEKLYREALEMARRLFKGDHGLTAATLCDLAGVLELQGRLAEAEPFQLEATAMNRRLQTKDPSPNGQLALAICIHGSGLLLLKQGKLASAEPLFREALEISRRIIKVDNPYTANFLNDLGAMLQAQGKLKEAEPLFREALQMQKRQAKRDSLGTSHCLNNLASLLLDQGRYAEAEPLFRDALEMRQRLFKGDHPRTALSLNNLALVLTKLGKYEEAEPLYRNALQMQQRLFKADHPDTALTLSNLSSFLHSRGKHAQADPLCREGLGMTRSLIAAYAGQKSEGEALTLLATLTDRRNFFLSNALAQPADPIPVYREVWASKAVVARVFEQRQLAARAATDARATTILADLSTARRHRADLLLAPTPTAPATRKKRDEDLNKLSDTIARLNRELRPFLPAVERGDKLAQAGPADLQMALPADTVVVDFLHYSLFEEDPKKPGKVEEKWTDSYLAFVVAKDKLSWIDLGPARPIEDAVAAWREAILSGKAIPPALPVKVRELVWAKMRKEIPLGVKLVYASPDLALCRVPWAALPGDRPGTILLEDYAVAALPHAAFLLDKLWPQAPLPNRSSGVLVVGGAAYDSDPAAPIPLALNRGDPLLKPGQKMGWSALPGAAAEAKGVAEATAKKKLEPRTLSGENASASAVLSALPKVRFTHLATHGFFADPSFRSAFQVDPQLFQMTRHGERIGAGALSPLVMTGLVFAGANRPNTPGRGVVTGEALVDLDLSGLELAVLSACETGLGDVAGGEGAFGLQRAFHLAGTRNVVASLWKVPDRATAALMALFYQNLWDKDMSPVEALRQAQLEIYHHPEKVPELAAGFRGKFAEVPGTADVVAPPGPDGKSHPRMWAAFTLSGPGR